jgi:uncharacterized protein with gpF-like domain
MLAMKKRSDTVLPPVHPNAGLTVSYQKQIDRLVEQMNRSVTHWLGASYRKQVARPAVLAADASPANELRDVMRKLKKHWVSVFDKAAPVLAKRFAERAARQVDTTMTNQMRTRDFSIDFKLSDEARNALDATVGENVALIKSIPPEYLADVEGLVMRSISVGGDMKTLSLELEKRYGITRRRAGLIARDQNAKATATMVRVRQMGLGITHAKWLHSHGGREPRASHVAFDGETYEIAKGAYIDGEWIFPGEKINCRCVSRSIVPG